MENIKKLYKLLVSKLPKSANTKIIKSSLDRGGSGVFTKRRKRSDKVIIPYDSFINNWFYDYEELEKTYLSGFRVLCTPYEYFSNIDKLRNIPILVRYKSYDELDMYQSLIDWDNVKTNRLEYSKEEVMFVIDIKNLDKFGKKGKSKYVGPTSIGQHEMDYASDEEILNVQMSLLFQMIKCYDFNDIMSKYPNYEKYIDYAEKFMKSTLYLNNPKLQEYSINYGCTVCPVMVNFPNKELSKISFLDVVNGTIKGDVGREDFNRTTTKVNLHHVNRLMSGQFNHNHKNVFLGTAMGNTVDSALFTNGLSVCDLIEIKNL
jgi:hypothetical protein